MKVVVTGGQFPAALAAARSLHRAGFRVVTVASRPGSYVRFSRASEATHRVPDVGVSASGFVRAVAAVCEPEEPTVVVPGTEPELFALAHGRELLPPWILGLPAPEVLDTVTDKARLNELARGAGLAIPETTLVCAGERLPVVAAPSVVKPVRTARIVGDTVITTPTVCVLDGGALEGALERSPDEAFVVQPLLDGDLYALAGVMWRGELLVPVQQVALSLFPWPCGGSALARTTEVAHPLLEQITALLRETGWEGVVQVQWIGRDDEPPALIDVNPRIYGSLALANAAGSPLAAVWASVLLGLPWEERERTDVLYRNLETFMRARRTPAGRRGDPRPRRSVSSVLDASDPLPLLASAVRATTKLRKDVRSRATGRRDGAADDAVLRVDDHEVADTVERVDADGADGAPVDSGDGMLTVRRRR